jgi:hypothetical protein
METREYGVPALGQPETATAKQQSYAEFASDQTRKLAEAYAAPEQKPANRIEAFRRERKELAGRFVEIEHMESVLALQTRDPLAFERLNIGSMRMAVGGYRRERDAAKRIGAFSAEAERNLEREIALEEELAAVCSRAF